MQVWIVMDYTVGNEGVEAVFATEALAKAHIKNSTDPYAKHWHVEWFFVHNLPIKD